MASCETHRYQPIVTILGQVYYTPAAVICFKMSGFYIFSESISISINLLLKDPLFFFQSVRLHHYGLSVLKQLSKEYDKERYFMYRCDW